MPPSHDVVLTRAKPGQEQAFHDWYDNQHLDDSLRLPEIRSAKRYRLDHGLNGQSETQAAPFDSLALYEIESDDPDSVARAQSALAGTEAMPLTEAYDRSATVRVIATVAGSKSRVHGRNS